MTQFVKKKRNIKLDKNRVKVPEKCPFINVIKFCAEEFKVNAATSAIITEGTSLHPASLHFSLHTSTTTNNNKQQQMESV